MSVPNSIMNKAKTETEKVILEALWESGRYWSNKSDNYRRGTLEWQECEENLVKIEKIIDKFADGKLHMEVEK